MRRSARSGRLLVAGVAVALGAIWVVPQVRLDENRVPPQLSPATWGTVADASLFRSVDTVLTDRLPLKGSVVHRTADLVVGSGLSPRSIVWRGEEGIPFYSGDFTFPCAASASPTQAMPWIRTLADRLEASGVPLLYAIVPDKSSAMRDELGPQADALMRCSDQVRSGWQQVEDRTVLVAWDEFAAARASGESLYFAGDTHWNWHGAALFSQLVLDRLTELGAAPTRFDMGSALRSTGPVEHADDLFLLMGVERSETAEKLVTERPGTVTVHEVLDSGERWRTTSHDPASPLIPGRTLVLRDSMFDYDGELLAPYFEDLTAVWSADFKESGLGLDYDLVIIQQVQRSVPQYLYAPLEASR